MNEENGAENLCILVEGVSPVVLPRAFAVAERNAIDGLLSCYFARRRRLEAESNEHTLILVFVDLFLAGVASDCIWRHGDTVGAPWKYRGLSWLECDGWVLLASRLTLLFWPVATFCEVQDVVTRTWEQAASLDLWPERFRFLEPAAKGLRPTAFRLTDERYGQHGTDNFRMRFFARPRQVTPE